MKKKIGLLVLLIAVAAGAVFAQRVGDTVQVSGQTYRIEQVSGDTLTLKKVNLSLNGVWLGGVKSGEHVEVNISGSSGTLTSINVPSVAYMRDAINKGYLKVGNQHWRNITSTGNLTWSGQQLNVNYNTTTNVANGTNWGNVTLTMSADGKTLTVGGQTYTRQ